MPSGTRKHFKGLRRASPTLARRFDPGGPIAKIDTRPMVFVFAFVVMLIIATVPPKQHALIIELWDGRSAHPFIPGSAERPPEDSFGINRLELSAFNELLWNGQPITHGQLIALLHETQSDPMQPLLEFEPDGNASYDLSAKAILALVGSGATFRIAGMDKHCLFGKGEVPRDVFPSPEELMRTGRYDGWIYQPYETPYEYQVCKKPSDVVHKPD